MYTEQIIERLRRLHLNECGAYLTLLHERNARNECAYRTAHDERLEYFRSLYARIGDRAYDLDRQAQRLPA